MRRLLFSLPLGLMALLVFALPVAAGSRVWCARDPIVTVDGTTVQIWVAVPDEYAKYVNDAVEVKIKTPKDVAREVIFLDEGFNGHGEEVTWGDLKDLNLLDGKMPIAVEVAVKFDKSRLVSDLGKTILETALGKKMEIPVMVTVNIGDVTETFETQVHYGTYKQTAFDLSVVTAVAIE